ncbi:MAG TPA: hypothetical protein VK662_09135 [Acidothermaceae bacterium]|nr:hypothetical protein [Acidothermaceae bacterium]
MTEILTVLPPLVAALAIAAAAGLGVYKLVRGSPPDKGAASE